METATGTLCIMINTSVCIFGRLNSEVINNAKDGRTTILSKLNLKAEEKLAFFLPYKNLPYKNAPSINTAMVAECSK